MGTSASRHRGCGGSCFSIEPEGHGAAGDNAKVQAPSGSPLWNRHQGREPQIFLSQFMMLLRPAQGCSSL